MTVTNTQIALMLNELADILEIEAANPFRVRAYRNAARAVDILPKEIIEMIAEKKDLREIPGIGDAIAKKIKIIVRTGKLPQLIKEEKRIPPLLSELMRIPGLGPKKVKALYEGLKINSIADLRRELKTDSIEKLPGFGAKTKKIIKEGLAHWDEKPKRYRLREVESLVFNIVTYMKKSLAVKKIEVAGSYRRRKETVADLDILVTSPDPDAVIQYFIRYDEVMGILSKGGTRAAVLLHSKMQVDLRVVPEESYGAALHYFTGSKSHNIAIRKLGVRKKIKINEYGIFKGQKRLGGKTESEVFAAVGLPFIPPEIREDTGEIEAALKNQLPHLIRLTDIRGDLHSHTRATDGRFSIEDMVAAAQKKGYEYLAITDHSQHLAMVKGLDKKRLFDQIKVIDFLNERLKNFRILKGIEVDILENGDLDLGNDVLKELDVRVCSVHFRFKLDRKKQTERIIRAMDNPYFNILGHATGRLINHRDPYELDIEKILQAAKERNCCIEINAQPSRLDLKDIYSRMAKNMGIKFAISTDAHHTAEFNFMHFGIDQARRAWLEPKDVINTQSLNNLLASLKR